nr:beta-fructofuranosidase, insoluble isoenzyme cwinv1 [Quercus suber]
MAVSSKCLLLYISLLLGYGVLQLEATADNQPYRTSYHFQPPKNWMNGPMLYKGIYHLFFQYNPKGAVRGNKVWGHSTSMDLLNWTPHEAAIYPSQPSDINGCWSGSTTILPEGRPVILYTGIDPNNHQVQNLAMPKNLSDPFLREWVKSHDNPLMAPNSYNKINSSSFRDPTTGWLGRDGYWRVIIGSKINQKGLAILYKSKDFVHWEEAKNPLYSSKKSDDTKHNYYKIGSYNQDKDIFIPDNGSFHKISRLRYDYGKFYASKTFFEGNSKHRRILWGWVNESSSVEDDIKKGWSGVQAMPRSIWLDNSGKQLVQWPIKEIETLRLKEVNLPKQVLKGGSVLEVSGVTAAQADVIITFEISELSKVQVLDPSWTDPQLLCSRKGASVKGGIGPFGLLVLASKGL